MGRRLNQVVDTFLALRTLCTLAGGAVRRRRGRHLVPFHDVTLLCPAEEVSAARSRDHPTAVCPLRLTETIFRAIDMGDTMLSLRG